MSHRFRSAHPDTVKRFLKNAAKVVSDGARLRLSVQGLDAVIVFEWPWPTIPLDDLDTFSKEVIALAQDDCTARSAPAKYTVETVRPDGSRGGGTTLAFMPERDGEDDDDKPPAFDGTSSSLVAQLLRSNKETQQQLLDMAKGATQAQDAAMRLLGQAYGHIQVLMKANVEAHDERVAVAATLVETKGDAKPDMFKIMMETMGPELAQRLLAAVFEEKGSGVQ